MKKRKIALIDIIKNLLYNIKSWHIAKFSNKFRQEQAIASLCLENKRTLKKHRRMQMKSYFWLFLTVVLMAGIAGCPSAQKAISLNKNFEVAPKVRLTTLEESPTMLSQEVADQIISAKLETMTVDTDCFNIPACREQVVRIKRALPRIKIRIYWNAMELFENDSELSQRPLQWAIANEVRTNRPGYYLRGANGERVQWWTQYPMFMMNISDQCPAYNGQRWTDYLVEVLYEKAYKPNSNLIDGIEIDNLWPYVSWINDARKVQIDLNNDGRPEDFWTIDHHWRIGFNNLISAIRQKFPAGFIVTGRGFHYRYAGQVDGLTLEAIFAPYMVTAMQGGEFARVDRWIRLSGQGPYYTLNEEWGSGEENLTKYAIALLGNGYFALDRGPSGHGLFQVFSEYRDLGRPIGPPVYPYEVAFNSNQSLTGLSGDYVLENGWIRLNSGQSVSLDVKDGYLTQFYYQIIGGKYCSSTLEIDYPGKLPKDDSGSFDAHRWQDGEYYALATGNGEIRWTYTGPGYALIRNVIARNTNVGNGYFMRQYEKGLVCYNPGQKPLKIQVSTGGSFILNPGQGQVLLYQ